MHSALVRIQNVFGFFTTVAFCTAIVIALSVTVTPQTPSASIELRNVQVQVIWSATRSGSADNLTSLFNWNTKQLFVWVAATYPAKTRSEPQSQAVIWDAIINSEAQKNPSTPFVVYSNYVSPSKRSPKARRPSKSKQQDVELAPGSIRLKNSKPKYQITDISGQLHGTSNVTLEVGWNVQPWVGALTWTMGEGNNWGRWRGLKGGRSKAFDMPALKVKGVNQEAVKGLGKPEKAAEASPIVR
ncbi:MAG: hypothetical protein Q9201_004614 [Fulgogasparrea decipioides]